MSEKSRLSSELRELLEEVVAGSCPDLLDLLDSDPKSIAKVDRERIVNALSQEIAIDKTGNIDKHGRQIDELISYIWSKPLADESE